MTTISVEDLKKRMDSGEALNIIDVREQYEYDEFNIGAKLVPLGKIAAMDLSDLEDLKEDEIILHCKAGMRSGQACAILEQAGYKNVVNVAGGMNAWLQKFGR
jgi:rhodanese-related sulfurtransferase